MDQIEPIKPSLKKIEKWAALAGQWIFTNSSATYEGSKKSSTQLPMGIALGSERFRNGRASVKIKLTRNERTSAGILFGYQSFNAPYFIAQLGAYDKAYAISEYRPGYGWTLHAEAGSLSNLDIDQTYEIILNVSGQNVIMIVNDVQVLDDVLSHPIEGIGFGLFAWDDAKIEFHDLTLISEAPRVFVIMPFTEPFETLYSEVILPVTKQMGFDVVRVDEIHGPGIILDDIQRQIEQSNAVVAEISTHNPNVFYELGYAHALRKPAVLLVRRQEGKDMPFDVRGYRAIFYDDTIGGKKVVENTLREHFAAILRNT